MINSINYKNNILENLIKNQKDIIDSKSKLVLSDLKRLTNNLSQDIFGDTCSLWNGPVLVANNKEYISFFINGKKVSLNRILYKNYVGELEDKEYLKFSCINKGRCCTLNHFYKVNKKIKKDEVKEEPLENVTYEKKKTKSNIVSF
jgi:hypothetical protein